MNTQNTITAQSFPKLFKAIKAEQCKRLTDFIDEINAINDVKELNNWRYNELLPKGKDMSGFAIKSYREYLKDRKTKKINAAIEKEAKELNVIGNADDLESVKISMEWKKSAMWGNNPNAECWESTKQHNGGYYLSGSIGGCGYDKGSTAVAQVLNQCNSVLNQCNSVLKALYAVKEKNINTGNRELFGYGSGSSLLPRIEGGVGVGCYPAIFAKIGFKFQTIASGKTFDVYTITKEA